MEKAGVKSVCDNHVLVELMRVPIWGTQLHNDRALRGGRMRPPIPDPAFMPGTSPDLAAESGRTLSGGILCPGCERISHPDGGPAPLPTGLPKGGPAQI